MSVFEMGERRYDAFSGLSPHVNKRMDVCIPGAGPIPPGTYFIVDRESGGRLGWLYDMFGQRGDWFALYANDGKIDDSTYCNEVRRGNFRLHPAVGQGISKGCITIKRQSDFNDIRDLLKSGTKQSIPGTTAMAYGKVIVT